MANKPKKNPIISANRVTAVRLLGMPLLAWLLYQGSDGWWWSIGVGFIVGSTDFVDGMLARKYGPTVLGGMLDPLADKVFTALYYLPLMHLGFFPGWAVGLLFVREFLVTAMRSAYEWRGLQLQTSYLGKLKTWVQMQGGCMMMLTALVPRDLLMNLLIASTALPFLVTLYFLIAKKRLVRNGAVATGFMLLAVAVIGIPDSRSTVVSISIYLICGLTWVSGLNYLVGGLPKLYAAGGVHRADLVRVLGSIATPVSATLVLLHTTVVPAPIYTIIAIELAIGGLDNLLSRHQANTGAGSWSLRTLGSAALLILALFVPEHASALCWAAMGVTLVGGGYEFWRGRAHYLDDDNWDEQLAAE